MKRRIIAFMVSLFLCMSIKAQYTIDKPYDYPVKPGTEEWAALSTHDEMLKVCQIPTEKLSTVTTNELVEICLDYPLLFDFYAYNNLQEGVRKVATDFNGLQELLGRKDNVQCLLDLLKNNDLGALSTKNYSNLQLGSLIVKQSLVETFLSHELMLANANSEQLKEIAAISMKNIIIKEQQPQLFSQYSLESSAYLLCADLKKINNGTLSPSLELFLKEGSLQNGIIEELGGGYSIILIK